MAVALRSCYPSPALAASGSHRLALWPNGGGRSSGYAGPPSPTPPSRCLGRIRQRLCSTNNSFFSGKTTTGLRSQERCLWIPSCTGSTSSGGSREEPSSSSEQSKVVYIAISGLGLWKPKPSTPFGYTRKDVLLIGLGMTVVGVGLKIGLEFVGVDPLLAGNVVQLVIVLGLTVGWVSTYMFRVASKDMTYAQQLKDYEKKVMEKRLESLSEAELEALLEQVEEEKRQVASGDQVK